MERNQFKLVTHQDGKILLVLFIEMVHCNSCTISAPSRALRQWFRLSFCFVTACSTIQSSLCKSFPQWSHQFPFPNSVEHTPDTSALYQFAHLPPIESCSYSSTHDWFSRWLPEQSQGLYRCPLELWNETYHPRKQGLWSKNVSRTLLTNLKSYRWWSMDIRFNRLDKGMDCLR